MRCTRCGFNVPDFLWTGDDHPVIEQGNTMVLNQRPAANDPNQIIFSVEMRVGVRSCKDVFPMLEIRKVDGRECVVIHLVENTHARPFLAACSGKQVVFPAANDHRPTTLCEACKSLALKG